MKKLTLILMAILIGSVTICAQTPDENNCKSVQCVKKDCKKAECAKTDCKKAECVKVDCKKAECVKADCKTKECPKPANICGNDCKNCKACSGTDCASKKCKNCNHKANCNKNGYCKHGHNTCKR